MLRRITLVLIVLAGLLAVVGNALGTQARGVSAETARGELVDRPLDVSMEFENGSKSEVELKTKGRIEVAVQRIVAVPGASSVGTVTRVPPLLRS